MVIGSQHRILQILIFSILPNPQTTILQLSDASWKSFYWIPHLPTFCLSGLVVDGTVVGKDSMDKKTREVADNMIYHLNWNFLQLGSDKLWWWGLTSKILSTCLAILSTCELVVDDTVDSKDNLEEETGEVAKIRIYHVTWIFFNLDVICWGDIGWHPSFFCLLSTCGTTLRTCELVVDDTVDSKDNLEEDTMKLLKSECTTLIGIFSSTWMWYAWVIVVVYL